jgi:glycerol uptake facilitator-like aquaporin
LTTHFIIISGSIFMSVRRTYTDFGNQLRPETSAERILFGHGPLEKLQDDVFGKGLQEIMAPYFVELCGTFLLTLTYLCNLASGDPVWAVTSNGFMVVFAMYSFAHVSGAKLNPCISIALYLSQRLEFSACLKFCLAQVTGGVCAALLFHQFAKVDINLGPRAGFSWWEATVVECLYTAMICFVYLNCAASPENNPVGNHNGFVGLAVGLCYIAGGYAAMQVSGTVMNPALAIGVEIADLGDKAQTSWGLEYLPAEIVGALLGTSGYRLVRPCDVAVVRLQLADAAKPRTPTSARIMAEFLGTFCIIFTKALNNVGDESKPQAWSVAAAIAACTYSLRGVSGGHFNPAVTLSATLCGKRFCTPFQAVLHCGAQTFGGLAASFMYGIVHHGAHIAVRPPSKYHIQSGAIILGETLFTCLLCYAVLTTNLAAVPSAERNKQNNVAGLAVGMCSAVGGFAIGNISGAILNPAMALGFTGLNLIGAHMYQSAMAFYIAYQLIGAVLAACFFQLTHVHASDEKEHLADHDESQPEAPAQPTNPEVA